MLNIIIYHGCKPRFVEKKKVVCFNNIVSFGLTTNPPKESKGMACDVFLQRIITDSHGASVPFRAIPLHRQLSLMLVATGFTRNIRATP